MTSLPELQQLLDDMGLSEAATFTAVRCADEDAVIRAFGGDPAGARTTDWAAAEELREEGYLLVARSGPAVIVVEDNDFLGSDEEILAPLSRLGRAASAFWNVNAHSRLSLAEDGELASAFDMLSPDERDGARPDAWEPYVQGLDLKSLDWPVALTALERATGATLGAAWAAGTFRAVDPDPIPSPQLPPKIATSPLLQEEPFATYAADLGPHQLPAIRRHALELALAHTGLTTHPQATAALTAATLPEQDRAHLHEALLSAAAALPETPDTAPWPHPGTRAQARAAVLTALAHHTLSPTQNPFTALATPLLANSPEARRFWLLHHLYMAAGGA